MSEVQAIARKWGDSIAVIIPNDVVKEHNIKPLDKITVIITKTIDFSGVFGKYHTKKSAQQIKEEMRSGWE